MYLFVKSVIIEKGVIESKEKQILRFVFKICEIRKIFHRLLLIAKI